MKRTLILAMAGLFVASLIQPPNSWAWGKTGHRISGELAEPYLNESSRKMVEEILPNESMAEAGPWADYMRSNPDHFWQEVSHHWHYVTIPQKKIKAVKEGNAITALTHFSQQLKDKKLPLKQRQLALRFIIHIISDLHQPLHAGNGHDLGANKVEVQFFGRKTNLHRLWDSQIIDEQKLSYTEWAKWLGPKITAKQAKQWCEPDPTVWVMEGRAMHKDIYPKGKKPNLKWNYIYYNLPRIKIRLQQSGVRLACYLNQLSADY